MTIRLGNKGLSLRESQGTPPGDPGPAGGPQFGLQMLWFPRSTFPHLSLLAKRLNPRGAGEGVTHLRWLAAHAHVVCKLGSPEVAEVRESGKAARGSGFKGSQAAASARPAPAPSLAVPASGAELAGLRSRDAAGS